MNTFYGVNPSVSSPKTVVQAVKKPSSLGNTTDNSAIRTQQGFQAIKERFKLLDSARKILEYNYEISSHP